MDYDAQNVFAKILRGEIPCAKVYEDEAVLAFNDIAPQAPTHIVIIPKKARPCVAACDASDTEMLGRLQLAAVKIAAEKKLSAYRLVVNCGADAGQTVFHLHLHLLGGRPLTNVLG
ncbi:histidine triad nucleotide-binding protein [Planctomycetales bacterium]|nr:histidine triad nucleotide-binding protein [Planctomycetales bacterium]GHS99673.1 histidine triad nucleotide-binding protein [Planctomycetales bacterium]GHT06652.1 histidine triad nucleotide-binding protein [Planctomycetales bacterium]GHV23261.1 histidine triad nucleotide-binding protein [Planctomycetales bacterium]GHV23264.1 histidine triad nucleotide-binding protein [Planctomycetales bacterium]